MIEIGINPISWSNDDLHSLGGHIPLETCLSEAKQAGYDGLELGHKFPREPEALKAVMEPYGLKIVSGWYSGELLTRTAKEEIEAVQKHLNLLKAMGSNVMVWAEVTGCVHGNINASLKTRPTIEEDQWQTFCERMSDVAKYIADQGVHMAYHHHMGTAIETEAEIDRMMENTADEVGLLVDTGHLTFAEGDPYEVLARYISRVKHVHCKDMRQATLDKARSEDWSFLKGVIEGVFTVPGDGFIDYQRVINTLAEHRYEGWLVVEAEQDPEKANPLEYATKGYNHLVDVCNTAGLALKNAA